MRKFYFPFISYSEQKERPSHTFPCLGGAWTCHPDGAQDSDTGPFYHSTIYTVHHRLRRSDRLHARFVILGLVCDRQHHLPGITIIALAACQNSAGNIPHQVPYLVKLSRETSSARYSRMRKLSVLIRYRTMPTGDLTFSTAVCFMRGRRGVRAWSSEHAQTLHSRHHPSPRAVQ